MGPIKAQESRSLRSRVIIIIVAATAELIKNQIICNLNNKILGYSNLISTKMSSISMGRLSTENCPSLAKRHYNYTNNKNNHLLNLLNL
jgi:hypothetical protein